MKLSEERKKEMCQFVLDKRDEGKVVFMGLEGPMSMSLENMVQQPVDGLLYDLNRLEEVTLTFMDDPKWLNDFAVALVIRKLKSNLAQLKAEVEKYNELIYAVATKHPEESRHETALRYIQECESPSIDTTGNVALEAGENEPT